MNNLELFNNLDTLIFDVDGVLTNSELIITEEGKLLRKMNTRDGYAIKQALKAGFRVAIITGGKSQGVVDRLRALGIQDIYYGIQDKIEVFDEYLLTYGLSPASILYMGDDLPDYHVMKRVGLAACPSDAAPEIVRICRYVSPNNGGEGCVRDVIEKILRLKGLWEYE